MKPDKAKKHFRRQVVRSFSWIVSFFPGTNRTNRICWSVFGILVAVMLSGCKKESQLTNPDDTGFPVNQNFAAELIRQGVPADIAQFFAAARMDTLRPNDTTCIYRQTFPNGAGREITLKISPSFQYTPTAEDIANIPPGGLPVYAFTFASAIQADNSTKTEMSYYVAKAGLPKALSKLSPASGLTKTRPHGIAKLESAASIAAADGVEIYWEEIAKTGADVSIGSLIDYAKEHGIKVGPLGDIYALASALASVVDALDLSKQVRAWLAELDALESCAAHPTNPLAASDPSYSARTVALVQSARTELKVTSAMRYLNKMTETGAGITPVTAILSIGLKEGFVWSEQTLNEYSENTIMREARLAVVPCSNSWSGTSSVTIEPANPVYKINGQVNWVLNSQQSTRTLSVYNPEGTLTLEMLLTGISITPSSYTLTHADGELRIDWSSNPPTYTGSSFTAPWSVTWITGSVSMPGLAGGAWFYGDGSVAGNSISGSKTVSGLTFTYSFSHK